MRFNCLSTGIGSLPFTDTKYACDFVLNNSPHIPFWPQLPKKEKKENMYNMFSEHLPGLNLSNGKIFIDSSKLEEQERFLIQIFDNEETEIGISEDYASGLYHFLSSNFPHTIKAIKGHVTGPVSFGLQINDELCKPILYNDLLTDILIKNISGIIRWQEKVLSAIHENVIIFVDEPYMSFIGSSVISLDTHRVQGMIEEIVSIPKKAKIGLHCCGNTDWSLILNSNLDIVSFDAYEYAENFLLYRQEIAKFVKKGGVISWGIIPTDLEQISKETTESLYEKLIGYCIQLENETNLSIETILSSSLLTPACGFGARDQVTTIEAFSLSNSLSSKVRENFFGGDDS